MGKRGNRGAAKAGRGRGAPSAPSTSAAQEAKKDAEARRLQGAMKLPLREDDLFKSVMKSFEGKLYDRALSQADKILEKYPYHGETLSMKGLTLININESKRDEAFALIKLGLSLNIKSSICWHVFGLFYRHERNLVEACKAYRNAIECKSANTQLLRDLPGIEVQIRDFSNLVQSRKKLLDLQPSKEGYWLNYSIAQSLAGRPTSAMRTLDIFLAEYKKIDFGDKKNEQFDRYAFSELYIYRASLLQQAGQLEDALQYLLSVQKDITDKYGLREMMIDILFKLERYSHAEKLVYQLIEMNPENLVFHNLLFRAKRISTPIGGEVLEDLLTFYDGLVSRFPREEVPRRQPLEWIPADDPRFRLRLTAYLRSKIRKGIPSLFKSISSLLACPAKNQIIGEIVQEFLTSLQSSNQLPGESVIETPVTYVWTLAFLAQYYNLNLQYSLALDLIDQAIQHTPTILELYVFKSKIYESQGELLEAAEVYDFARKLDLADRHINTRCVKRMLRVNRIDRANELISLFTREGDPPQNYLYDMQCLWFELESADAYLRLFRLGRALKKYIASHTHFQDFVFDQMDFHEYCARRAQMNSYLRILGYAVTIRTHPQFLRAVAGIARCYTLLHDLQTGKIDVRLDPEAKEEMDRMEVARKKQEAIDAARAQRSEKKEKIKRKFNRVLHPVEKDPEGFEYTKHSPLAKAQTYLEEAAPYNHQHLDIQFAGFEVYIRLDHTRILLALRYVKRAFALEPTHPQVHVNLCRLWHRASSFGEEELPPVVRKVLFSEISRMTEQSDSPVPASSSSSPLSSLLEFNAAFVEKHRSSLGHMVAAAKVIHFADPPQLETFIRENIFNLKPAPSPANLRVAEAFHIALSKSSELNVPTLLLEFSAIAHQWFPLANRFVPLVTTDSK